MLLKVFLTSSLSLSLLIENGQAQFQTLKQPSVFNTSERGFITGLDSGLSRSLIRLGYHRLPHPFSPSPRR